LFTGLFLFFIFVYSYCNNTAIGKVFPHQEHFDQEAIKKVSRVLHKASKLVLRDEACCFYDMVNNNNNKW
jgi:hypothetical protein